MIVFLREKFLIAVFFHLKDKPNLLLPSMALGFVIAGAIFLYILSGVHDLIYGHHWKEHIGIRTNFH